MASMETIFTFRLDSAISNQFSGAFNKAAELMNNLKKQNEGLQKTTGQITSYKNMQTAVAQTSTRFEAAKARLKALGTQITNTAAPTAALKKQFESASNEAMRLERQLGNQQRKLNELRSTLQGAGVDTAKLGSEQARLSQQTDRVKQATDKLAQARSRFAAARKEVSEHLSWQGMQRELSDESATLQMFRKPVATSMDFEQAMARVNAAAFSGGGRNVEQDKKDFELLKKQAIQLGGDTKFTAVEAANAQENLARAGFKANQIISAMPSLLNLAASEEMDLASTSDITASALRGFNLKAEEASRVANVLSQTSSGSNTNVRELGEAMKYVAPIASGLGISIEQTSAMMGVMANAGIKGSQGGTALRAALSRLSREPKAVAKALKELGIKATDAQGKLREMPELMQALAKRMKGMGEAEQMKYLMNIFGSEAGAGMLAVMKASVDGTLQELEMLNNESNGIFKELAKNSNVSLEEFRAGAENSIKYARKLGISYQDLAVTIAMLGDFGIQGAKADERLTNVFKRLSKDAPKVQKALKPLNISLVDKDGKMRNYLDLFNDIRSAIKDFDSAKQINVLENIFGKGNADTVQKILQGIDSGKFAEYTVKANGAEDIVSEKSRKLLETFKGQLTLLDSAFSKFLQQTGDTLLPLLTPVVTMLTDILNLITKAREQFPLISDMITTAVVGLGSAKVALTGIKIAKSVFELPVAMLDVMRASKEAKNAIEGVSASSGLIATSWGKLKNLGSKVWDAGKLVAFHAKQIIIEGATKAWSAAQWLLNAAMSANPVGLLIIGIAALIGIGYALYKNWDKIKKLGIAMWDWIKEKAQSFADWWNSWTLADIFAPVTEIGKAMWSWIKEKAQKFAEWWDSWTLGDIFEAVKQSAINAIEGLKGLWQTFKDWLKELFSFNLFGSMTATPEQAKAQLKSMEASSKGQEARAVTEKYAAAYGVKIPQHALGGIFSTPHIGMVAEAGREAIIPLEDKVSGIPLWRAAGEELGLLPQNSITNNNGQTKTVLFSPNVTVTIYGDGRGNEVNIKEAVLSVLSDYKNDLERLAFA